MCQVQIPCFLISFKFKIILVQGVHVSRSAGEEGNCSSTMWVLGTELSPPGLVARAFVTYGGILLARKFLNS